MRIVQLVQLVQFLFVGAVFQLDARAPDGFQLFG
jgi:hypothetical protein